MMDHNEVGTKLVNAKNEQIYPRTKIECVEGLNDILDSLRKAISSGGIGFTPIVVDSLDSITEPVAGVVYRVKSDGSDDNKYSEYYYIPKSDEHEAHFEQIGGGDMQWLGDSGARSNEWL